MKNEQKTIIRAGIIGLSGYTGFETLKILLRHDQVRVTYVSANTTTGPAATIWPQLRGQTKLVCEKTSTAKAAARCDVVFLAVPHTGAMALVPPLLKAGKVVIDLSADYRLKSAAEYKKWYHKAHSDKRRLGKSVYGLPELFKAKIQKASLIANPGCYPTAAILGLAPLVSTHTKAVESVTIDAKSGVSGAGKKLAEGLMFTEANENFKAYRVLNHQHTPEIETYLSQLAGKEMRVTFVPHLLPINRGILSTMYARFNTKLTAAKLQAIYKKFYKTEPFVRVLCDGEQPEIKNVAHTNYCDIGLSVSADGKTAVVTSAIDNLVKGAAGQAVQNMNLVYGFEETKGLIS